MHLSITMTFRVCGPETHRHSIRMLLRVRNAANPRAVTASVNRYPNSRLKDRRDSMRIRPAKAGLRTAPRPKPTHRFILAVVEAFLLVLPLTRRQRVIPTVSRVFS